MEMVHSIAEGHSGDPTALQEPPSDDPMQERIQEAEEGCHCPADTLSQAVPAEGV